MRGPTRSPHPIRTLQLSAKEGELGIKGKPPLVEEFESVQPLPETLLECGCSTKNPKAASCVDCPYMRLWIEESTGVVYGGRPVSAYWDSSLPKPERLRHGQALAGRVMRSEGKSVAEIAAYFGVTERSVYAWLKG
jgi:hypothetical protein